VLIGDISTIFKDVYKGIADGSRIRMATTMAFRISSQFTACRIEAAWGNAGCARSSPRPGEEMIPFGPETHLRQKKWKHWASSGLKKQHRSMDGRSRGYWSTLTNHIWNYLALWLTDWGEDYTSASTTRRPGCLEGQVKDMVDSVLPRRSTRILTARVETTHCRGRISMSWCR